MNILGLIAKLFGYINLNNIKSRNILKQASDNNHPNNEMPAQINLESAITIELPWLKLGRKPNVDESSKQDWPTYWAIYNKAVSFFNRKQYAKAKEVFLNIINWQHSTGTFYNYLLRTHRRLIEKYIKDKRYDKALYEAKELFVSCSNHTNTDIKTYNYILEQLKNVNPYFIETPKELIVDTDPDYVLNSDNITYIAECKRPRGYKLINNVGVKTTLLKLRELSYSIPLSLPHILYDDTHIEYVESHNMTGIDKDPYRFNESLNGSHFIISTKELNIFLYDWDLRLINSFNAIRYSEGHTHLRCVDLSSDLSCFLFTTVDMLYLLGSDFNIVGSWEVPFKEGWEKRKRESTTSPDATTRQQYIDILKLQRGYSHEDLILSFRNLIKMHHPDKNPNDPHAESITKKIIEAYEYLSGEEASKAFEGAEDEEYWVDTLNIQRFNVQGFTFEIQLVVGSGEDWIYGSGLSDDGKRIYLGCYSGKVYQINRNGEAQKIYIIPQDKDGYYGRSNPISKIIEQAEYLHILTYCYLYILQADKLIKYIDIHDNRVKWSENGFIILSKKNNCISCYLKDGECIGSIIFKDSIRHLCQSNGNLMVETSKKALLFRILSNSATNM